MFLQFADNRNENSWASKLRRRRIKALLDIIPADGHPLILDVGGTEEFWTNCWNNNFPSNVSITILNLVPVEISGLYPVGGEVGDARDLSKFGTGSFDICFSNSMIEHVGTLYDQMKVAQEIRRVARRYFVQTPYRFFPIEPHFHFPIWPILPTEIRVALHRRYDLGFVKAEGNYLQAKADVEQIRLLSRREFGALFPDATILQETIGPLLKSIIAVR